MQKAYILNKRKSLQWDLGDLPLLAFGEGSPSIDSCRRQARFFVASSKRKIITLQTLMRLWNSACWHLSYLGA